MAPSSAYAMEPKQDRIPAATQIVRIAGPEGRFRAMALGRRKMPDPITIPMMMTVASSRPSFRGSSSTVIQTGLADCIALAMELGYSVICRRGNGRHDH